MLSDAAGFREDVRPSIADCNSTAMVRQNRFLVSAVLCFGAFCLTRLASTFVGAPVTSRPQSVVLNARGGGEYDISTLDTVAKRIQLHESMGVVGGRPMALTFLKCTGIKATLSHDYSQFLNGSNQGLKWVDLRQKMTKSQKLARDSTRGGKMPLGEVLVRVTELSGQEFPVTLLCDDTILALRQKDDARKSRSVHKHKAQSVKHNMCFRMAQPRVLKQFSCAAPFLCMAVEPSRAVMWTTLALVVAPLVVWPRDDDWLRLHHHQLEMVEVSTMMTAVAPYHMGNEPNDALRTHVMDDQPYDPEETDDQFACADDDNAFEQALVAYWDFREFSSDSGGCLWQEKCCESGRVGTPRHGCCRQAGCGTLQGIRTSALQSSTWVPYADDDNAFEQGLVAYWDFKEFSIVTQVDACGRRNAVNQGGLEPLNMDAAVRRDVEPSRDSVPYDPEETYGQFACADDDNAFEQALVAYWDFKEFSSDSDACGRRNAVNQGGLEPLDMDAAVRRDLEPSRDSYLGFAELYMVTA
eukprot:s3453_g7.t1